VSKRSIYTRPGTLDLEEWRAAFTSLCCQCDVESDQPGVFSGWVQPRSVFGFSAAELGFNSVRTGRTLRHTRADGLDHYVALISTAGSSTLLQNDQAVTLDVGDISLVDKARPVTFNVCGNRPAQWLAVRLPRRRLISHLGFEPQAGLRAPAGTQRLQAALSPNPCRSCSSEGVGSG
jgi:AraC family transcriptional activator of tynA and feaB